MQKQPLARKILCSGMILLFFLFSANPSVYALPQGYEVVSGDVQFDQIDANTLHITASDQAIINFSSFNIGSGETVQFFQPGSSSSVLSRVTGEGASSILGNLFANGQLILVNPYGMSFGPSANVQVGSLIASTLDITNQDYLARNYTFSKNPNLAAGLIVNEGLIQTNQAGGLIALMSPNIRNSGTITAQLGTVALVSGDRLTMSFDQDGLISFVIEDPIQAVSSDQPDTAIHNIGQIIADGGIVLIQAKSALGLIDKVINNEGLIQARSMVERQGHIFLEGGTTGLVVNRGTLDTSSAVSGVDAGEIKMNGEYVSTSGLIKATASDNAKGGHVDLSSTKITALTSLNTIDVSGRGEASDSGDVRIWSDENTYFQTGSRILANGGEISGDGGLIEVSGHDNVFINGSVQAQAVNGESGMFFIDPTNLEITNGSSAGSGSDFTGDLPSIGGGSVGAGYITEASLEALAATVNISIVATGTITLNDLSDNVLTLATNAAHSVTLSGAAFTMNSGDTINVTGGGTLTILTTGASGITVGGLTTNNAAIQLTSYTATTVNGAIASNGGSVTIYNDANDSGSDGNFTMNSGSSITSGGGAITIVSGILNGGGTTLGTYTLRTLSSSGGSGNIIVANGISSAGSITQAGNITTGTGYYSGVWGTGGYTMNFGTSITTGGGISLGLTSQGTPSGSVSLQTLTTSGGFTCCGGGHQYSVYANTSGSLTLNEAITASASSSSVDLGIYLKGSTSLTQNSSATITASHASRQALAMETNGAMTLNANITAGNTALGFDEDISGAENFTANASIDASGYLLIYQGNGVSGGGNITLGNDSGDTVTVGSTNIGNPPNVSFYAKTNGTITTNAAITSSSGIYLDADVNSNGSGTQLTIGNTITATNNNVTLSGGNGSVVQNANITSGTFASYFGDSYTMAPGTSLTATGGASFGLTGGSGPTGDITLRTLDVSGSFSCCGGGTYTMYVVTSGNVSIEGGSVSGSGDIQVISDSDGNGSGNLSTGTTNLNGNAILIASGDLQNSQTGGGDVTIGGSITSSSTADFGGGLPAILIGSFEGSVVLGANVTNTSTGQVVIIAGDEITMNSSVAVTGNGGEVDFYFDMEGNGAGLEGFTMGSGSSINANSGNVIINSTSVFGGGLAGGGDIVLTSVTGNTVDIQTATGAISDGNGASVNLTASSLTLTSATALGTSSDSLEIAATTLAGATVSGTGGIFLSDTGGLAVTSAVTASGDIAIITSSGNLTATTVTAGGSGSDVILTTTTSGNISVGNVTAAGDSITITSAGNISESGADVGADLTASTLTLSAVGGIGTSAAIETQVSTLYVANSTSGNINLANTGNLTLNSFSQSGGGDVAFSVASDMTIDTAVSMDGGDFSVTASTGSILQNANVVTGGGSVTYSANQNITMGLVGITTSGGNVDLTAGTGGSGNATITGIDVSGGANTATVIIDASNGSIFDAGYSPISVSGGFHPDIWTGSEALQATNIYLASSGYTQGTTTPFGDAPGDNVQGKVVSGIGTADNPLSIFGVTLDEKPCEVCDTESNGPTEKLAVLKDKQCLDIQGTSYVDMSNLAGKQYVTVKPGYYVLAKRNEVIHAPMKGNLDNIVQMLNEASEASKMPAPAAKECICCSESSNMQLASSK